MVSWIVELSAVHLPGSWLIVAPLQAFHSFGIVVFCDHSSFKPQVSERLLRHKDAVPKRRHQCACIRETVSIQRIPRPLFEAEFLLGMLLAHKQARRSFFVLKSESAIKQHMTLRFAAAPADCWH